MKPAWRIELASSPDTAPLYLALSGDRIEWQPDVTKAMGFLSVGTAWDYCFEHRLPVVRINCR